MRLRQSLLSLLLAACASEPASLGAGDSGAITATDVTATDVTATDVTATDVTATDEPRVAEDRADVVALQDIPSVPDVASPSRLRVLFIGNSYTYYNDLPAMVASLGASTEGSPSRPRVVVESLTEGGATLQRHWELMRQDRVRMGPWDAVVLQGQSVEPIAAFQGFDTYARRFAEVIRGGGARVVFYATWARRAGDVVYGQSWSGGSFEAMTRRLDNAYRLAAMNTAGEVAPVGARWADVVGQRPATNLYDSDGSHPSVAGSYLAACVLYRALTGVAVAAEAPVPMGLSAPDAAALRAIAAAP